METKTELPLEHSPVRLARARLNLTLKGASRAAGINYQTWYLTECACYDRVPLTVLHYLENQGFSSVWLEQEYKRYQERCRTIFFLNYYELFDKVDFENLTGNTHPVEWLRKSLGLSRQGFAKELCIQPAVLYKVESGRTKSIPQQLNEALIEVGLPETVLTQLREETEKWLKMARKSQSKKD